MKSILIIGGGAAGLMAAHELCKHKIPVTVLEANSRLGGRIYTLHDNRFSRPVETGAEFIHGDLPITLGLLKEAGIAFHAVNDSMYHAANGKLKKQDDFTGHWDKLMKTMASLQQDMALEDFLYRYFDGDAYAGLRKSVTDFAGGFDLANIKTASTRALYREWSKEMEIQYRIDEGYGALTGYLETSARDNGCVFTTNCCVKKISWQPGAVNVLTMCSRIFKASAVIVTVPIPVLQANVNNRDYLEFEPSLPLHMEAANNIGFGPVIKILIEFSHNFWNNQQENAGFIFMDEQVPTWWTQMPVESNILTGWLGGEKAISLKDNTGRQMLAIALQSLANAFGIDAGTLEQAVKAFNVTNWTREPYIHGGYSFSTLKTADAKKLLNQPVQDTVFFAGEALYHGIAGGTVEAALNSGKLTAGIVLKCLQ